MKKNGGSRLDNKKKKSMPVRPGYGSKTPSPMGFAEHPTILKQPRAEPFTSNVRKQEKIINNDNDDNESVTSFGVKLHKAENADRAKQLRQ